MALNVMCYFFWDTVYIEKQLERADRVDIVWDQHLENSLKSKTRKRCGKWIWHSVEVITSLPGNWQQFLRLDANKQELFNFWLDTRRECST